MPTYSATLIRPPAQLDRKKYDKLVADGVASTGAGEGQGGVKLDLMTLNRVLESNILDALKNVPFLRHVSRMQRGSSLRLELGSQHAGVCEGHSEAAQPH